ncbi:hypothetical protein F4802DRAFT_611321 [Xylaria palmicola]|nr:hypothetical protein F4802DRAFT_611321 [Xylaria palmicola]
MANLIKDKSTNKYYFLYEWLAEIKDITSPIELPDLQADTTTTTTSSTPLTPLDSTFYPPTPPKAVITAKNGETRRLLPLVISRLDTLEHFVTKVNIAIGKINDFIARINLAIENIRGYLQRFSASIVGLFRGWGFLPYIPSTTVNVETGDVA